MLPPVVSKHLPGCRHEVVNGRVVRCECAPHYDFEVQERMLRGVKHLSRTGKLIPAESMTSSEFVDDVDVNRIMERALKGGVLPEGGRRPVYGDFSGFGDFQEAQNRLVEGRRIFGLLSARDRLEFKNDPAVFLAFAAREENRDAVVKMLDPEEYERIIGEREIAALESGGSGKGPAAGGGREAAPPPKVPPKSPAGASEGAPEGGSGKT